MIDRNLGAIVRHHKAFSTPWEMPEWRLRAAKSMVLRFGREQRRLEKQSSFRGSPQG
jgi:hypothetical protein